MPALAQLVPDVLDLGPRILKRLLIGVDVRDLSGKVGQCSGALSLKRQGFMKMRHAPGRSA
eukprot:scaffold169554_cov18-Tisochrysis_lutea.AAC.2